MPVRNEGFNIKFMLKLLRAIIDVPYEVLVVYDTVDDDTVPMVQSMPDTLNTVKLVYNDRGRGVVNALRVGIDAAVGEYILLFAVDEVGPILAIEEMISLMDEGCDLVSGTRYAFGGRRLGGSLIGGLLSRLANKLFRYFSGSVLTDATTGIKMFRSSIFDQITLESRPIGWAVVFEIAIKVQIAGMKLGEVPIISIDRLAGGKSTFSLGPWIKEYSRWFFWGLWNLHVLKGGRGILKRLPSGSRI